MIAVPKASELRPDLPLRFVGGEPALDLINTVDWTRGGPRDERLTDYARFIEFAQGTGLIDELAGKRLRTAAARDTAEAAQVMGRVYALRYALQRAVAVLTGHARRGEEYEQALAALNEELHRAMVHRRVTDDHGHLMLTWPELGRNLESPLWPLVWSAAQLLSSDEQRRIRACADPDCGWVYVDRSRNGMRRWCQMETCGNRAKANRRYARIRQEARHGRA
jgi:predicted RNA-binding Zn ribbon-like protein